MYRIVYLANLLLTTSAGIIFVILADLKEDYGLAGWEIGVVAAMGFVSSLLVSLFLAPIADRGHLQPVAAIGLGAGIVGNLVFAFADSFLVFASGRALIGIGIGLFLAVARKALIGLDTLGSGQKLGVLLSTNVAGFLIGPILGWILKPFGFSVPFLAVSAALAVVAVPAVAWIRDAPVATSRVRIRDMGPLLRRPAIQGALLGQLFLFGNIGLFDSVADLYLTDLGASDGLVAALIFSFGAPLLILPGIAGGIIDRRNPPRILVVALFLAVPTIAAFGWWESLVIFAIAAVIEGTIESFAFPAAQVVVVEETGAGEAAIGQSLLDIAGLGAAAVAAASAPAVYEAGGAPAAYGGMALIGAVLALGAAQRLGVRRSTQRFDFDRDSGHNQGPASADAAPLPQGTTE